MPEPPDSVATLMDRARALAGLTVAELGLKLGIDVPEDQRRAKGLVGQMLERTLGATAASRSEPDFPSLGVELKSIPINDRGRPQESTFVCTIALDEMTDIRWEQSRLARKLNQVLFVPVESRRGLPLPARRIGFAVLWSPNGDEVALLRDDWEELAGRIGRGDVDALTGHTGQALQVRPKGATGRDRRRAPEADGAWQRTMPRGFYLRANFTQIVLERLRLEAAGK